MLVSLLSVLFIRVVEPPFLQVIVEEVVIHDEVPLVKVEAIGIDTIGSVESQPYVFELVLLFIRELVVLEHPDLVLLAVKLHQLGNLLVHVQVVRLIVQNAGHFVNREPEQALVDGLASCNATNVVIRHSFEEVIAL